MRHFDSEDGVAQVSPSVAAPVPSLVVPVFQRVLVAL